MGRIRRNVDVGGEKHWTLFDSGARNTYVVPKVARTCKAAELPVARSAALGGKTHQIKETCLLVAEVDGHPVETHASVIDEIGKDEDGQSMDILFGTLAMHEWGIRLDVPNERLDLTRYSRDFIEFAESWPRS
jgi:hypothetical protein